MNRIYKRATSLNIEDPLDHAIRNIVMETSQKIAGKHEEKTFNIISLPSRFVGTNTVTGEILKDSKFRGFYILIRVLSI